MSPRDIISKLIEDLNLEASVTTDYIECKILDAQIKLLERLRNYFDSEYLDGDSDA